ncbi:hypothetical protein [Streptomyces sp. NPDC050704]|uniref:hypothetical protein n=1 Tax=Streptomyces sp. NPDC050704 TaxID=3157219 RepID=UPI0034178462
MTTGVPTSQGKTGRAKTVLLATFALAVLLNLADAVWNPSGDVWFTLRVAASGLFTVALAVFIALYFRYRRRQRL